MSSILFFDLEECLLPKSVENNIHESEIADARSIGGVVYSSLGEALRASYEYLNENKADRNEYGTPCVASSAAQMTDEDRVYVYTGSENGYTNGNWYYYDGSWKSGGVYNALAIADKSVTAKKLDINSLVLIEDMSAQTCVGNTYTHSTPTSTISEALSYTVTIKANTPYYAYLKIKINSVSDYTDGKVYLTLRGLSPHVFAENVLGLHQELKEGYAELYGQITPSSDDDVSFKLSAESFSTYFSYSFTVEKLYLIENGDYTLLPVLRSGTYREVLDYFTVTKKITGSDIAQSTVEYNNLSPSLKTVIDGATSPIPEIIDIWGDDVLEGDGEISVASELTSLISDTYTVNDYSQGGENAESVAFRQGSMHAIMQPVTMPSNFSDNIYIDIKAANGASLDSVSSSDKFLGNLYVTIEDKKYWFDKYFGKNMLGICDSSTLNLEYTRPVHIVAEGNGFNHTSIFCVGYNGWVDSDTESLISVVDGMIRYNSNGNFIVVGRPNSTLSEEAEFKKKYTNNYFNTREYISEYGVLDNALSATAEDTAAKASGNIPPSLKDSDGGFNAYFFKSLAYGLYLKGKSLKLWQ